MKICEDEGQTVTIHYNDSDISDTEYKTENSSSANEEKTIQSVMLELDENVQ